MPTALATNSANTQLDLSGQCRENSPSWVCSRYENFIVELFPDRRWTFLSSSSHAPLAAFQPQAESYPHRQIPTFKALHPNAPEKLTQNTLIIGSAGTGKSMVMRQLSARYEDSDEIFPLYIHAEFWLSRALAEAASVSSTSTIAIRRTHTYANAMLALAVIERLTVIGQLTIAGNAARSLFGAEVSSEPEELFLWIDEEAERVTEGVRSQVEPAEIYARLPLLPHIFEQFGKIVERQINKRLLLLVDQLDKVSPTYFTILGSALGRSRNYILCVATRPSVCAPEATILDSRVGDYGVYWLGGDWSSGVWHDFLLGAAARHFSTEVCALLSEAIATLTTLVGPSTREFLFIGDRLQELLNAGGDPHQSLSAAAISRVSTFQGVLGASLAGVRMFDQFRAKLEAHIRGVGNSGSIEWPSHLDIGPDDQAAFVKPETQGFLRTAIREGMLVPKDVSKYGLDGISVEYQIVPMAIVEPGNSLHISSRRSKSRFISEADLKRWANPAWGVTQKTAKTPSVFYSYWMDDRNSLSQQFISELQAVLGTVVNITTGRAEHSGGAQRPDSDRLISDQIRHKIRDASLVLVQLDPMRIAIGIEIGWALTTGRQFRLLVSHADRVAELPPWLRIIEFDFNGTETAMKALGADALMSVDEILSGADPTRYLPLGDGGETIKSGSRELTKTLIVGSGDGVHKLAAQVGNAFAEQDLNRPILDDTSKVGAGARVIELVAAARRAGTLAVVLSGDQSDDALAAVALGAFTYQDSDSGLKIPGVGSRTLGRDVVLVDLSGRGEDYVPRSMTGGLKGVYYTTDPAEARERILQNRLELQRRTTPSRKAG